VSLNQHNSSQILQNCNHQYPVKNSEPETYELYSTYSKMPPHVHLDHSDHYEDQYSHHEQQTEQPEERLVTREQHDKQLKSVQPRQKKPVRGQL
jgi:hypothetical protein